MAVGWYLVPYRTRPALNTVVRYCGMDDYTTQVFADAGAWAEVECLGTAAGWTIVKVRASAATLTTIAADAAFTRIPVALLDDSLGSLTAGQKAALVAKVEALGYTLTEVQARFPNPIGTYTLRDVLAFVLTRRLTARFNGTTIVCDGPPVACDPIDQVEGAVQ